ncbi:MAG: hypothetical protein RIC87_06480 [Kiloniellales bacterium]
MQIDWITTAAQFVNFFILIWLLQRFLYRPITKAISTRQAEIARRLGEAREREETAKLTEASFREQQATLEAEAAAFLERAASEAEALALRLKQEVQTEAEHRRMELKRELAAEQEAAHSALRASAGETVLKIAESVLNDLADTHLEELLVRRLLREVTAQQGDALRGSLQEGSTQITLRTRWPLDGEGLRDALAEALGRPVDLVTEDSPDSPLGAVIEAPGLRAEWTLEGHLAKVGEHASTALEPATGKRDAKT